MLQFVHDDADALSLVTSPSTTAAASEASATSATGYERNVVIIETMINDACVNAPRVVFTSTFLINAILVALLF